MPREKQPKKDKPKPEPRIYGGMEAAEKIAKVLIPKYHSELASARIKYVCVSKGGKKGGKIIVGKARKLSGAISYLTDADFLIEVALPEWNTCDDKTKVALIDHLLERCFGEEDDETGDMKWSSRDPDVNEFSSILQRHGAWSPDLFTFVNVASRIDLNGMVKKTADKAAASA